MSESNYRSCANCGWWHGDCNHWIDEHYETLKRQGLLPCDYWREDTPELLKPLPIQNKAARLEADNAALRAKVAELERLMEAWKELAQARGDLIAGCSKSKTVPFGVDPWVNSTLLRISKASNIAALLESAGDPEKGDEINGRRG